MRPAGDSMRRTSPLKLKDDPGNRRGNKWYFDGNLSALLDPPPPSRAKAKAERMVVTDGGEGEDSANAESRR